MSVVDVLERFAAKQASQDAAMRALVEHDGWFVPALLMPGEHVVFDKLIMLGTEGRTPSRLWIFTEEQLVHVANGKGFAMGIYGGPVAGTTVFSLFSDRFPGVDVNAGSPIERTWYIGKDAFPLAKVWAGAIAVERALAGDVDTIVARLRDHDGFLLMVAQDNTLVRLPLGPDQAPFALAFTAPDWMDAFVRQLNAEQRTQVKSVTIGGRDLFGQLERLGVQGVIMNVTAPERARSAIPLEIARLVAAG